MTAYDRPTTITDTGSIQAEDAKDGCPRCGGKVIFRFFTVNTNNSLAYNEHILYDGRSLSQFLSQILAKDV